LPSDFLGEQGIEALGNPVYSCVRQAVDTEASALQFMQTLCRARCTRGGRRNSYKLHDINQPLRDEVNEAGILRFVGSLQRIQIGVSLIGVDN
jgi:hypothetical protein